MDLREEYEQALTDFNANPRDAMREQKVQSLERQLVPKAGEQVQLDGGVTITDAPAEQPTDEEVQRAAAEFQVKLANDPEFGMAFDENLAAAQRAHTELFGDRGAEVAERIDGMLSEPEKIIAMKLLAKLGRR